MNNILKVEEYNYETGTDLEMELSSRVSNITNNAAEVFIKQVEDFINISYYADYGFQGNPRGVEYKLDSNGNKVLNENGDPIITYDGSQLKCYKQAIIYQIIYELQNGSLWNDSGYNLGTGLVVNPTDLLKLGIPEHVHNWMRRGGMANIRRG